MSRPPGSSIGVSLPTPSIHARSPGARPRAPAKACSRRRGIRTSWQRHGRSAVRAKLFRLTGSRFHFDAAPGHPTGMPLPILETRRRPSPGVSRGLEDQASTLSAEATEMRHKNRPARCTESIGRPGQRLHSWRTDGLPGTDLLRGYVAETLRRRLPTH